MYARWYCWHCAGFRVRSQEQACDNNQRRLVPGFQSPACIAAGAAASSAASHYACSPRTAPGLARTVPRSPGPVPGSRSIPRADAGARSPAGSRRSLAPQWSRDLLPRTCPRVAATGPSAVGRIAQDGPIHRAVPAPLPGTRRNPLLPQLAPNRSDAAVFPRLAVEHLAHHLGLPRHDFVALEMDRALIFGT